jgi:hypothetical protein
MADEAEPSTEEDAAENRQDEQPPEDRTDEPGAEGGSQSSAADRLPGAPAGDDDSELGDTDQHSEG